MITPQPSVHQHNCALHNRHSRRYPRCEKKPIAGMLQELKTLIFLQFLSTLHATWNNTWEVHDLLPLLLPNWLFWRLSILLPGTPFQQLIPSFEVDSSLWEGRPPKSRVINLLLRRFLGVLTTDKMQVIQPVPGVGFCSLLRSGHQGSPIAELLAKIHPSKRER